MTMASQHSESGVDARSGAVCRALQSCLPHYDAIIARRPTTPDSLAQLNVIDKELWAIDTSAALLRRRRNALSPASCLYPEILAHIFGYLRELYPPEKSWNKKEGPVWTIGWVRVTHVCSYWRTVALENPWLWSRITFHFGQSWVEEHLRRAGRGPLYVDYNPQDYLNRTAPHDSPMVFNRTLQDNGSRIHALTVQRGFDDKDNYPISFLNMLSSPNLQIDYLELRDIGSGTPPTTSWPNELFAGDAPSLRSLDIYGSLPNLFVFIAPMLKHLCSLKLHHWHHSAKMTFRELHQFLSRAGGLQYLHFGGYEWPTGQDNPTSFTPIQLPKMKDYHVEGALSESITLFRLVRIPQTCSVTIACGLKRRDDFTNDIPRLALALARKGGPLQGITTLEVASRLVPKKCYMISGWRKDSPTFLMDDFTENGKSRPRRDEPDCRIILQQPASPNVKLETHAPVLASLFHHLPVHRQLINLSFRSSGLVYDFTDWSRLRRECSALRWLRLDKNIASSFAPKPLYGREPGNPPYSAPSSVQELVLVNVVNFSPGELDPDTFEKALRARGQADLTSVVTNAYKLKKDSFHERFPDLRFQYVSRVYRDDAEDKN